MSAMMRCISILAPSCLAVATILPSGSGYGFDSTDVSSCNGMIAFSSSHEGNPEIYLMKMDGSMLTRLTDNQNRDGYPAWSPDGTKIAFYAYEDSTTWSINVMDSNGENRTRLTGTAGVRDAAPVWSPDGTTIAFSRVRDDRYEIWVMDPDGGSQRRLGDFEGFAPQWSPDGSRLAFCTVPRGEIFIVAADGSSPRQLTDNEVDDMWPAWSPDGAAIAFMSGERDHHQIWLMNADGSGAKRLTNNGYDDWRPMWSPDGSKIAFLSFREGKAGIYLMNSDGTEERHLTPFSDYALQVAWCPK